MFDLGNANFPNEKKNSLNISFFNLPLFTKIKGKLDRRTFIEMYDRAKYYVIIFSELYYIKKNLTPWITVSIT